MTILWPPLFARHNVSLLCPLVVRHYVIPLPSIICQALCQFFALYCLSGVISVLCPPLFLRHYVSSLPSIVCQRLCQSFACHWLSETMSALCHSLFVRHYVSPSFSIVFFLALCQSYPLHWLSGTMSVQCSILFVVFVSPLSINFWQQVCQLFDNHFLRLSFTVWQPGCHLPSSDGHSLCQSFVLQFLATFFPSFVSGVSQQFC